MLTPLFGALSPLGVKASAAGITYLLRDEFTTDAAAPLASPRTCEPGGGTLTITDAGNKMSIVGGALSFKTATLLGLVASAQTRVAGLMFFDDINVAVASGFAYYLSSSYNIALSSAPAHGFYQFGGSIDFWTTGGGRASAIVTIANNTVYRLAIIHRALGAFAAIKGGVFASWTLLWVSADYSNTPMYPQMRDSGNNVQTTIDNFSVTQLSGGFATDYGIATNRVASPTSPTATISTANAILEFTWTPGAGETLELDTRRTDADNRWVVRCAQAGSTIKLIERNAGSETERASAAQTWSVGTAYRIVVIQDGNTIKTYVADVAKNSYASASFNNTATGVNVAGFATGTNLVCYPRDVSAYIPAEL